MGIAQRLEEVRSRIAEAATKAGRDPSEVTVVAVSKTKKKEEILEAYEAGHRHFGENRVQEFVSKIDDLPSDIEWHFVGQLQRNKVKDLVGKVSLIHSVDRLKLAREIDKRSSGPAPVLIEVNVAVEVTKAGIAERNLGSLIQDIDGLENIVMEGLMCMAPVGLPEDSRPHFRRLARLARELGEARGTQIKHLSMGMSQDYEVAVEEGASIVRIGEAIFGPRPRPGVPAQER